MPPHGLPHPHNVSHVGGGPGPRGPPLPHPKDLVAEDGVPLCAGCRLRIVDKYYLSAIERKWHSHCLKCSECGGELDSQTSCFERDGSIFCREDYLK